MNSEERDIIAGIFRRLEQAASQPRDAEAERLIADKLRAQPYATYAMAQLVYVQEEAIKSLNEQLEQMRAEAEQARASGGGGGFLSSIFGGGQQRQAAPQGQPGRPGGAWGQQPQGGPGYGGQPGYAQAPQQAGGPWSGQQQPGFGQQGQPQGRGFLGSALTTAAGVAGGMVVGSALMNAFSGGHSSLGGLSSPANAAVGGDSGLGGSSDFGSALHGGGDQGGGFDSGGFDSGGFQDASFDDADTGDSGSDDWV